MKNVAMRHLVLTALLLFVLGTGLRAQGLVQLTLSGEIDVSGGAPVEIEISYPNVNADNAIQSVKVSLVLAERTTASDFALLLERRLESRNVRVISSQPTSPARGPVHLFIENVAAVGLQLGNGLSATLTLCENRPASIMLTPGSTSRKGAYFRVIAHTRQERTKELGRVIVEQDFEDNSQATDVAARLVRTAIGAGWMSELSGHHKWMPKPMTETERVFACSMDLRSNADWRLDVTVAPR